MIEIALQCQMCGVVRVDTTDDDSIRVGNILDFGKFSKCGHDKWKVTNRNELKTRTGDVSFMSHPMINSTEAWLIDHFKKTFKVTK